MENFVQHFISQQYTNSRSGGAALKNTATKLDYRKIDKHSNAFAKLLRDAGCNEGEYLCCMTDKLVPALTTVLGIMKAGCICVPINPQATPEEIHAVMVQSDSRWLLTDESASSSADFLLFDTGEISLGWLGDPNMVPQDISPEFVADNMKQYFEENDTSIEHTDSIVRFVLPLSSEAVEEMRVTTDEISSFISQFRVVLNGNTSDRTAMVLSDNMFRLFSELFGKSSPESQYHLFASQMLNQPKHMVSWLNVLGVNRLILPAEEVDKLSGWLTTKKTTSKTVKKIIIWGALPSRKGIEAIRMLFPRCEIKNRISGKIRGRQVNRIPTDQENKSSAKILQYRSLDHWEKIFFGLIDETAFNRLRHVDFIQEMKQVYLNYWRNVEEKKQFSIHQPQKLMLRNDV